MTDRRIDQAFFGWSVESGQQRVLRHTFDDAADAARWQHRLQAHIRLQPLPGVDLPPTALSYFAFPDGTAAVLRRVNVGITAGRNNSHALIAPAELLTPRAALGMWFFADWLAEPPVVPLSRLSAQLVAGAVQVADDRLFPMACAHTAQLVPVIAGLLADPSTPISIVGCPDELRPAMVWAAFEVFEKTGRKLGGRSFSTYEDRHDVGVERLPYVAFLPARRYERGAVDRTVVELDRGLPTGPHVETARRLCHELVTHTLRPREKPVTVKQRTRRVETAPRRPIPIHESLVAALRNAETLHDFDRALMDMQRAGVPRGALRSALGPGALVAAANQIEVAFREELLRRLLAATYGPRLQDLADPQAQKHALQVVRTAASDQLAMMIAAAEPAASGPIRGAVFDRWRTRGRHSRPEPVAALARRLRALRRSRYLPLTAAVAALGILGVAFLGGLLLGRNGDDSGGAPPDGRIAGGYTTIYGVTSGDAVIAFAQSEGDQVRPQGPCLAASVSIWFCPSRSLVPGENATLVAYAIPRAEADIVLGRPDPRAPDPRWGGPHKVR
jgi:hypothetical protein